MVWCGCRCEVKQVGPVLVVAPLNHVDNWHSNWEFWTGPETNVVSYVGMSAARSLIHDHELWLSPESLDSKSSFWLKQGLPSRVRGSFQLPRCPLTFPASSSP